jgi:hypothetical protein
VKLAFVVDEVIDVVNWVQILNAIHRLPIVLNFYMSFT